MLYIGIDISKSDLHLAFLRTGVWQKAVIANETPCIQQWIKGLEDQDVHLIFEATGSYGAKLLYLLQVNGLRFTVLNPSRSKGFAQAQNNQSQTDARDAVLLAQYGAQLQPPASVINGLAWEKLRQVRRALRQLKKYERMLGNQRHALDQYPYQAPVVSNALEQILKQVQAQIKALESDLCDLQDDQMQQMAQKISTIQGIGAITARELIIVTNGFQHFENAKQVAKFIGIAPISKSSGKTVHKKGHISRNGDGPIRGILYMAAMAAIRCNKACKEIYQRLKDKGKSTKQALVAVAHKLLRQAFAVAKSGQPFDNEYYTKFQKA